MRIPFATMLVVAALLWPMATHAAQDADASAEDNPIAALPWQMGPSKGAIGNRATVDVPEGYAFLDAAGTRRLEVILENPPSEGDQYVIAPHDMTWIAFFAFEDIGYVKDDETVDAQAVLDSVRAGTEQSNAARREQGWEALHVVGWSFEPKYDTQLKALEWAILAEGEQSKTPVVNYNTRLLGRRGVMGVTLATDPASLDASIADFKRLMPGYTFTSGETYGEFRAGDHVAEIGLAALITGGAAALASKKGVFAAIGVALVKFWKLLLIPVIAIGAWVRKRTKGGNREQPST